LHPGSEAPCALEQFPKPDVLVSDIGMPGRDGYELIRKVRQADQGGRIQLALTAYASGEEQMRCTFRLSNASA